MLEFSSQCLEYINKTNIPFLEEFTLNGREGNRQTINNNPDKWRNDIVYWIVLRAIGGGEELGKGDQGHWDHEGE